MASVAIDDGAHNPFDGLPIETTQHIAMYFESDNDLAQFRRVCRSTHDAVEADNGSFWRRRFLVQFDRPTFAQPGLAANIRFKKTYQERKGLLKHAAMFRFGQGQKEKACLQVLRDLLNEAFSDKGIRALDASTYESPNLAHLDRFVNSTNVLQIVFASLPSKRPAYSSEAPPATTPLLHTIQILCAPYLLSLSPHLGNSHFSFPDSQLGVYSPPDTHPIFAGPDGLTINLPLVLHNINFWRYHMTRSAEQTLFRAFQDLELHDRPQMPRAALASTIKPVGRNWKGSYAFLDPPELVALRRAGAAVSDSANMFQDCFAGEDENFAFQDMHLDPATDDDRNSGAFIWPPIFDRALKALTPPTPRPSARTRAQKRESAQTSFVAADEWKNGSVAFRGSGQDVSEDFLAAGWLNPLPPQQGVPGWRRVTMMKYFIEEDDTIDEGALWAYEGVVLPGGMVMVGRWWGVGDVGNASRADAYSGPFVLWCVDK